MKIIKNFRDYQRNNLLLDVDNWQREIVEKVKPYSMAGTARTLATISAVEYIVVHDIPGAIVECGVWRGGQMMAVALSLLKLGASRELFLYDTFSGMTEPTNLDSDFLGVSAKSIFDRFRYQEKGKRWCEATLEEVKGNIESTGYSMNRVNLIQGEVEKTIPEVVPSEIALLRLDTDWYESTLHELNYLYPLVSNLGVIAIDDYGHWQGSRRATDKYLMQNKIVHFLHRIDYSGRQFVKYSK
ncbi:TylF/MycF/NovP-related O-methyltransferase [Microbulbifer echini]|uniref:TylF/MycF/NovP-related O-methyltransferase n=1 Tax=Microbulbifer echini TaxID=1529067 RepID=A0ABV4NMH3_9GAMM